MSRSFTTRLLFELAQGNHLLGKDGNRHSHSVEMLPCEHPMCRAVCEALYIKTPSHERQPDLMFGSQEQWDKLLAEMEEYSKPARYTVPVSKETREQMRESHHAPQS